MKLPKISSKINRVVFGLLASAALAGSFSQYGWIFNLCSHFQLQYAVIFALFAIWNLRKKQFVSGIAALLLCSLSFSHLLPYMMQASAALVSSEDRQNLRLLQMNVYKRSTDFQRISDVISKQAPDLVAFEEFNDRIHDGIKAQHGLDPYQFNVIVPNDSFKSKIALFSKLPIEKHSVLYTTAQGDPAIVARLALESGKKLDVIVMHPRPPMTPGYLVRQETQFRLVSELRSNLSDNVIVLGDLNTSPWAQPFKSLIANMELSDPRLGRGLITTWPYYMPLVAIPIDHILNSKSIQVKQLFVADFSGSDHLPLVMDCQI